MGEGIDTGKIIRRDMTRSRSLGIAIAVILRRDISGSAICLMLWWSGISTAVFHSLESLTVLLSSPVVAMLSSISEGMKMQLQP